MICVWQGDNPEPLDEVQNDSVATPPQDPEPRQDNVSKRAATPQAGPEEDASRRLVFVLHS